MSNSDRASPGPPAVSVHGYAFTLYRLESELRSSGPEMETVLDLLDELTALQGVDGVGTVGDEAEHCIEHVTGGESVDPESVALSRTERKQLYARVDGWIDRFESFLEGAVAAAPTTDLPATELVGSSQEFLSRHVGERFEAEVLDLNEAASNLTAGSYTSAEFMCIRAVERLLRRFFRERQGRGVPGRDWSRALETVADRARERGDLPEELQSLEYLRDRRAAIVDPRTRSSREDAEKTLVETYRLVDALIDAME
jgi:HEPN domain-containing protein